MSATATVSKSIPVPASNLVFSEVPVGKYAVKNLDTEKWFFFDVSRSENGKWTGWTFLKMISGDNATKISYKESLFTDILRVIARDPKHFSAQYGKRTGTCGICSKTLTDPESVARGIGPVCLKRFS